MGLILSADGARIRSRLLQGSTRVARAGAVGGSRGRMPTKNAKPPVVDPRPRASRRVQSPAAALNCTPPSQKEADAERGIPSGPRRGSPPRGVSATQAVSRRGRLRHEGVSETTRRSERDRRRHGGPNRTSGNTKPPVGDQRFRASRRVRTKSGADVGSSRVTSEAERLERESSRGARRSLGDVSSPTERDENKRPPVRNQRPRASRRVQIPSTAPQLHDSEPRVVPDRTSRSELFVEFATAVGSASCRPSRPRRAGQPRRNAGPGVDGKTISPAGEPTGLTASRRVVPSAVIDCTPPSHGVGVTGRGKSGNPRRAEASPADLGSARGTGKKGRARRGRVGGLEASEGRAEAGGSFDREP